MAYLNARRKALIGLLVILILFGFASVGSQWIGWVSAAEHQATHTHTHTLTHTAAGDGVWVVGCSPRGDGVGA